MEPTCGSPVPLSVLVVDDDPDTTTSCVELLTLSGYDARAAFDGEEALRAAAAHPPDVVLLDINLPKVNGWEVARRLREQGEKPPLVVVLSGRCQPDDRRRSTDAGAHLHLVKPVDPGVLLGVLRRCHRAAVPADEDPATHHTSLRV